MQSEKRPRGRPKATKISVISKKQISGLKTRFHIKTPILTYRDITKALSKKAGFEISLGTVWNLAHGKEPRRADLRRALGLSLKCPVCRHRLKGKTKTYKSLWDIPTKELTQMYLNRKEF